MNMIEVKNVEFSYEGKTVLKDVSFDIKDGDYLCVVGENGSGKTTLLKGLLSMKTPDSGSIVYKDNLQKKDIGYLSQKTNIQKDFPASVQEIVLSGLLSEKFTPFYTRSQKNKAVQKMEQLGILDMKKKSFRELSGGQQQRVLLARALCASVKLIIMDEPIAGLDPLIADDMYRIISELNNEEKLTVVMVSHDIVKSTKYAKSILHLNNSQLFWGTTEEYINNDVGKAYLERS